MFKKAFYLLMLACLLCAATAVPARAAPDAQLPTRTTHYITYNPQEFRPTSAACTYATADFGVYPTVDGGCTFSLPVILPGAARIIAITFFFSDPEDSYNLGFTLDQYNPETNTDVELLYLHSGTLPVSDDTQEISYTFPSEIDINNNLQAYQMLVEIPTKGSAHLTFKGARVKYTLPIFNMPPPPDDFITIAGLNFQPSRSDAPFEISNNQISLNPPQEGDRLFALFDLPAGGQIEEIAYYFADNEVGSNPDFSIGGWAPEDGYGTLIPLTDFDDVPPSTVVVKRVVTYNPPKTVLPDRRYVLSFFPKTANHTLRGVCIRYNPGTASTGAVQTRTLAGMDFHPSNNIALTYNSRGLTLLPTSAASYYGYYASLHLPAGKHISRVKVFFRDTNAQADLEISAFTYALKPGEIEGVGTSDYLSSAATTADNPQWIGFSAIALGETAPQSNVYRLVVRVEDGYENLELVGARVEYYTPRPVYLPVLAK